MSNEVDLAHEGEAVHQLQKSELSVGIIGLFDAPHAANQAFAADHFGHNETASALALHQAAERRIGHPRHRRDDKRRFEFDRSNFHLVRLDISSIHFNRNRLADQIN